MSDKNCLNKKYHGCAVITPPDMACWTQLGHFWWIFNPFRLPILQDRERISAWQQDVAGFFHVEFQSQHVATFMPQPGKWSGRSDWNSEACSCKAKEKRRFFQCNPYISLKVYRATTCHNPSKCYMMFNWSHLLKCFSDLFGKHSGRWKCSMFASLLALSGMVWDSHWRCRIRTLHPQTERKTTERHGKKNTAESRDRTLSWASDAAGSVSWKGTKWIFVNSGLEKSHVLHVVQVLFWMPTWHFLVSTSLRHKLCKLFKAPDVLSQSTKTLVRVATS